MPSSWPPAERTSPVSYIEIKDDDVSVQAKTTEINFAGTLIGASDTGGGAVTVAVGLQELTADPASPQTGDFWILRVANTSLRHSIPQIGLSGPPDSYQFYLKYRTSTGSTVSVELT